MKKKKFAECTEGWQQKNHLDDNGYGYCRKLGKEKKRKGHVGKGVAGKMFFSSWGRASPKEKRVIGGRKS